MKRVHLSRPRAELYGRKTEAYKIVQRQKAPQIVANAWVEYRALRRIGWARIISRVPRSSWPDTASLPRVTPQTVAVSTTTGSTKANRYPADMSRHF